MRRSCTFSLGKTVLIVTMFFLFIDFLPAQEVDTIEKSVHRTYEDKELMWGACPEFFPEGCSIAVLNGDPTKENADIFFKVPANSKIPNHWHTSAERMILVQGEMEVTYEGEAPQLLEKGSYAYGPAKKPHTAKCMDQGPCILFIAFKEPLDAFAIEKKD